MLRRCRDATNGGQLGDEFSGGPTVLLIIFPYLNLMIVWTKVAFLYCAIKYGRAWIFPLES